jgi:hypothetical protein
MGSEDKRAVTSPINCGRTTMFGLAGSAFSLCRKTVLSLVAELADEFMVVMPDTGRATGEPGGQGCAGPGRW